MEVSRCETPPEPRVRWRFQSSLTPWSLALYPLTTVQARSVCVPWFYAPPSLRHFVAWDNRTSGRFHKVPLLANDANVPPFSFSPIAITATYASLRLVAIHEGVWGLYRGFTVYIVHALLRDGLTFLSLRCLYNPLRVYAKKCFTFCRDFTAMVWRRTFSPNHPCEKKTNASQTSENATASTNHCRYPASPITLGALTPMYDWSHLVIKMGVDILLYPLVAFHGKLMIYEGLEPAGALHLLKLTSNADGVFRALYSGVVPYLWVKAADHLIDMLCIRVCHVYKLTAVQTMAVRAAVSSVLSTMTTPLSNLSFIQRTQSNLPGLCVPGATPGMILQRMPWKMLALNTLLTTVLASCNIAVFLSRRFPQPPGDEIRQYLKAFEDVEHEQVFNNSDR